MGMVSAISCCAGSPVLTNSALKPLPPRITVLAVAAAGARAAPTRQAATNAARAAIRSGADLHMILSLFRFAADGGDEADIGLACSVLRVQQVQFRTAQHALRSQQI